MFEMDFAYTHFTMHYLKAAFFCCTCIFFLSYCKNKPVTDKTITTENKDSATRDSIIIDTANIEVGIRRQVKRVYSVYSDTVKTPAENKQSSTYYSITKYYYDSTSRELIKTENILVSANKSIFAGYFFNGEVVKTIANTDMGHYVDYFAVKENPQQNNFRAKCFLLAKQQLSVFNERVRK